MMNSDLLKRERIREALTARLLQLSKQCEEICSTPGLLNNDTKESNTADGGEFSLNHENSGQSISIPASADKTKEMKVDFTDSVLPTMINNYVTPCEYSLQHDLNPHFVSNPPLGKAFYKTLVPDRCYRFENNPSVSALSDIVIEVPSEMQSDCDSHLLLETPSTDLDHYMNNSLTVLESPNDQSFSALSDVSSETDHVTVVSLTSDTDSDESSELQSSHDNILPVDTQIFSPFPKVLNELPIKEIPVEKDDENAAVSDTVVSKTPRRRRLSYTLESPSPILERALKNCSVGPENESTTPKCTTDLKTDSSLTGRIVKCPIESPQHLKSSDHTCVKETSTDKPGSARGYFSPRSRIPVINSIRPNITSVLFGVDQEIQSLDTKSHSLTQYLNSINPHSSTLQSPVHQQKRSVDTRSPNRSQSLPAELQSLCQEISLQRKLLTEQSQQLQALTDKQEAFFNRILTVQQEQTAQLQRELTHNVNQLFAQQSVVVEARLQNLEDIIHKMAKTRLQTEEVGIQEIADHDADLIDGKPNLVSLLLPEGETFEEGLLSHTETVVNDHRLSSPAKVCLSDQPVNFDKVSAAVKGYLTRRLMKTEKVQALIQTIKDTMECALKLHEMARNNAVITRNDAELHQRLINQVTSACHAFHNVFFKYSVREKMDLIAQSRQLAKEKAFKTTRHISRPCISSATVKSLERKNFLKSKSVSPSEGRRRRKWKGPKRPSTAMEAYGIRSPFHERKLSLTPVREANRQSPFKGDCRSPSFYM